METIHDEEWRGLHERLRGIARRRAALDAEEARCLREAHDMKLWRRLGYAHMNEYLERELGYAPQVGIERLRIAYALAELPRIEASLADGDLAYSAVRELTRVATADTEQAWLDKARGRNLREIEAMVSGRKRGDRPEDPSNPDLTKRVLRLELGPAAFALFREVQRAMADEHTGRLDDSTLIEVLCRRALEGSGSSERPPYQIAITMCESCGRGWQNGAGREVDVGREAVDRALCDAEMIGSLEAQDPERVRTTVTPRVRRQVLARDHYRCTVPGCRSARNLDLHHIEFRSYGGSNEISNLTTACSAHHKSLHEGLLTIRGTAPHALEFVWSVSPAESVGSAIAPQLPPGGSGLMRVDPASSPDDIEPVECNSAPRTVETELEHPDAQANRAMIDESARAALVTAGYKSWQARAAVDSARPHVGAGATLEQVLREALRRCAASIVARSGASAGAPPPRVRNYRPSS
jgi:hypothetical protein